VPAALVCHVLGHVADGVERSHAFLIANQSRQFYRRDFSPYAVLNFRWNRVMSPFNEFALVPDRHPQLSLVSITFV